MPSMLGKVAAAAAVLVTCVTIANGQFIGGIGPACPPTALRGRPTNVQENKPCGGYCNSLGDCGSGLECQQAQGQTAQLGLIGSAAASYCRPAGTTQDEHRGGCAGCTDHVAVDATFDEDTLNTAHAVVGLINAESNAMYGSQFVAIVPGTVTTQVVAGTRYTMSLQMAQTACRNTGSMLDETQCPVAHGAQIEQYHIDAVFQAWMHPSIHLLSFTPEPVTASSIETAPAKPALPPPPPPAKAPPAFTGAPRDDCGDGSMTICMVRMQCPDGTVSAPMNGCVGCVDPYTCLPAGGH